MLKRARAFLSVIEWRILLTALVVLTALSHVASSEGGRALELTESILLDGSLSLDGVVVRDGFVEPTTSPDGRFPPPVGEPHDRSFYDGHYFFGAAPGLSIAMLPASAAAHAVFSRLAPDAWRTRLVRYGVLNFVNTLAVIVPVSLLTLLFVHRTHRTLIGDGRNATLLTFVYAFGTLFFFHGVQPNVWQIVNCVSWAFIHFVVMRTGRVGAGTALGLGVAVAVGLSMNYFAGILLPLFGLTLLARRDLRAGILLGTGFAIGVLPVLWYHYATFQDPFTTPYSHRIDAGLRRLMASGFQGFFLPSPVVAFKLLVHPYHGLFVYAPITVVSLWGLAGVRRDRVLAFAAAGSALILLAIAGRHADYHSGQGGFGSRYIVPMLPFTWLLVLGGFSRISSRTFEAVAIVSVVVSTVGAMFGGKLLQLGVAQFLIRGIELPSLVWLKQVLEEFTERRPPVSSSGVVALSALALWLIWRSRPLLTPAVQPERPAEDSVRVVAESSRGTSARVLPASGSVAQARDPSP